MKASWFTAFCLAFAVTLRGAELLTLHEDLGTPPDAPIWRMPFGFDGPYPTQTGFSNVVNIASRETSRQFFNSVYTSSENVPMDWSGSYATGAAGTNSADYLRAVLRRVNYYRSMAGLPSVLAFDAEYTRKSQEAALMMGGNNTIDHYPPPTWAYYTEDGAEAARSSNLSLGNAGPQAVMGQMRDNGANNAAAGHRRWILYPQTQVMGSGNVPATNGHPTIGVLWVFDTHFGDPRPATRDTFVAWPPPGYVPYQVTYARWSFSYPNADFTLATVTMTSNGVPITTVKEPVTGGAGENTIVWIPAGLNANNLASFPRPAADTVYHVTLSNVRIGGVPQTFGYDVIVFDPAVPGPDFVPLQITGPATPYVGESNVFQWNAITNATGYEWRQSRLTNVTFTEGAEAPLTNFTIVASTNDYAVRSTAAKYSGTYSIRLAHPQPPSSQVLTLNRTFLVRSNSAVQFRSRLGYAAADEIARVQVSLDGGGSWEDIYSQAGSGGAGEASFNLRTAALSNYVGRTIALRLNYEFISGSYFPPSIPEVGWYIDDFAVTNVAEVLSSTIAATGTNRVYGFVPPATGPYLLEARPMVFGEFPGEWGPGVTVNAVTNTTSTVRITSITRASATTWTIDFTVLSGGATAFEIWSSTALPGGFALHASTIQVLGGGRYRATVTSATPERYFLVKPL